VDVLVRRLAQRGRDSTADGAEWDAQAGGARTQAGTLGRV